MPDPEPGTGDPIEVLRRLEERLDAASEAAERLLGDAARHATGRVPPMGWQQPAAGGGRPGGGSGAGGSGAGGSGAGDAELVLAVLGALRDRIPPDLQQRLTDALREVLLAVRALIDWYLQRTDRAVAPPTEVEDIPIL